MSEREFNKIFSERLRYYLGKYNMTQLELAKKLGVGTTSVYNWTNGIKTPRMDKVDAMCRIFHCRRSDLIEDHSHESVSKPDYSSTATPEEFENIIKKYRTLDQYGKETVDIILDRESDRMKQMQSAAARQSAARIYTYMHKIACAGTGYIFDDIPTDTIEAPYMEGADFIIGVSGDSMEPTYYDGDLVYVRKQETVPLGDIGIFVMHNECYIKELGEHGLLSHNRKYEMIPGDESIQCVGKVLGKVEK